MPLSNRRCAVSLHEVAKCTVPRRWSVSSCASAGDVKDAAVAAIAMADAILNDVNLNDTSLNDTRLNMGTSLVGAMRPERWANPIRTASARQFPPPAAAIQLSLQPRSATARLSEPCQKAAQ